MILLLNVKKGDTVYVVWAEWSSGDSFGFGERNHVEVMEIFRSKQKALACAETLEFTKKDYKNEVEKTVPAYRGWIGYFERLDAIHVEETVI